MQKGRRRICWRVEHVNEVVGGPEQVSWTKIAIRCHTFVLPISSFKQPGCVRSRYSKAIGQPRDIRRGQIQIEITRPLLVVVERGQRYTRSPHPATELSVIIVPDVAVWLTHHRHNVGAVDERHHHERRMINPPERANCECRIVAGFGQNAIQVDHLCEPSPHRAGNPRGSSLDRRLLDRREDRSCDERATPTWSAPRCVPAETRWPSAATRIPPARNTVSLRVGPGKGSKWRRVRDIEDPKLPHCVHNAGESKLFRFGHDTEYSPWLLLAFGSGGVVNKLKLATSLFVDLADKDVRYVHWKSNEHLDAALRGETDLDLLIDSNDLDTFLAVVDGYNFVEMHPPGSRVTPGGRALLGFDRETGSLVHLDVYERLILGERHTKNHHLPLEDWLLSETATLHGVRTPTPERELVLLFIRAVIKTTRRQLARAIRGRGVAIPERILDEIVWLVERIEPDPLKGAAVSAEVSITGEELVGFAQRAVEGRIDVSYLKETRRSLIRRLRRYERSPRLVAVFRRAWLRSRASRPARSRLGWGIAAKRLSPPTPLIAVVGADGCGKTTLTTDIHHWLEWKLGAQHVYFGQPKSGFFFRALNRPGGIVRQREATNGCAVAYNAPPSARLPRHRSHEVALAGKA